MKKQLVYLFAAIVMASCLLFSSPAKNPAVNTKETNGDGTIKNTCKSVETPAQGTISNTFPGIVYIEM